MYNKPESLIPRFPKTVSFFGSAFNQEPDEQSALGDVLDEIRAGTWEKEISLLQQRLNRGDQKGYDDAKRKLPAFTMSAHLHTRSKDVSFDKRLVGHSGILQADFDLKENPQMQPDEVKALLAQDPHVAFVFTSPSGRGIKAGVAVDPDRHRGCFFRAESHFLKKYGLQMDRSTKDVTRMCFVSSDPDMVICDDAFPVEPMDEAPKAQTGGYAAPIPTTAKDIEEMLAFIPSRPDYDTWIRIASAVWSVLPMEEGCRVLAAWSPEEKTGEYEKKWEKRLEEIGIGTLVYLATQYGFDAQAAARRKLWAGRVRFCEPTTRDASEDFSVDPNADVQEVELDNEFIAQCMEQNQFGDAQLWAKVVKGRKLYDHLARCWRSYSKGIWVRDEMQSTLVEAVETVAGAYDSLIDSLNADLANNPPEDKKDVRIQKIKTLQQRVWKVRSTGYMTGVMTFAETLLGSQATKFDRSPELLATTNGVIDFKNGVFREHRASDMLTHKVLCDFNPDALCPRFRAFLEYFLQGKGEMIRYFMRAIAYSLTGYVDKDVLFFLYGKGANGKSTAMSVIAMLLGDLQTTVSIEALLAKASDNNFDYKKAQMEGKRLVVSDEIPENRTLNESSIKSLVGGDPIAARRPYEKPYVFDPTHKLWLVGNHKPNIKGTDYGIWRRVHLIPWLQTMPEEDRRPRHELLSEFREELPGILSWAIEAYIEMEDLGGLKPPKTVVDATKEYQSDSDQFARFLEDRTVKNYADEVSLTDLREIYQSWCQDEGETPRFQSNKGIRDYMVEAGFETRKRGNKNRVNVLGLKIQSYENAS